VFDLYGVFAGVAEDSFEEEENEDEEVALLKLRLLQAQKKKAKRGGRLSCANA